MSNSNGGAILAALGLANKPLGVLLLLVSSIASSAGASWAIVNYKLGAQAEEVRAVEARAEKRHEELMTQLGELRSEMRAFDTQILREAQRANDRIDRILQKNGR